MLAVKRELTSLAETITSPEPCAFSEKVSTKVVPSIVAERASIFSVTNKVRSVPFSGSLKTLLISIDTGSLSSRTSKSSIGLTTTGASLIDITVRVKDVESVRSPSLTSTLTSIDP